MFSARAVAAGGKIYRHSFLCQCFGTMLEACFRPTGTGPQPVVSRMTRIDKTSPIISGLPKNCQLTPVKHQLVKVATVKAIDSVSGVSSISVTATSSDPTAEQPPDDVPGDIVIDGGIVQLRAEGSALATRRTYTITATATDSAGNTTTARVSCTVPK